MNLRSLVSGLVGVSLLLTACSVSAYEIRDGTTSSAVGQSETNTLGSDEGTLPEPSPEPTPEPEAGPCGPAAVPTQGLPPWPVSEQALEPQAIVELAAMGLSTDFEVTFPVVARDADDPSSKFVLGPAWPVEIEKVEPTEASLGGCQIIVVFTTDGLEMFNQVAAECFASAPRCPLQRLAIVVDGQVLSNPSVQSPRFDDPNIVVSSATSWDIDEAPRLAQAIAAGVQLRPVLAGAIPI